MDTHERRIGASRRDRTMSRKDRKDRAGLRPTTLELTASEVKDEPVSTSFPGDTAETSTDAVAGSAASVETGERISTPGGEDRAAEERDAEQLMAETSFAQAVDSERDMPPVDPPEALHAGPPPKPRAGSSWRAWTLGLLASAAIGAGAVWWLLGQTTGPAELAALKSRLDTAETRIEATVRDLAEARTALSQVSASIADAAGKQQQAVAALEQKIAATPAGGVSDEMKSQVEGQRDAIGRLDAAVGELKSAIAAASKGGDAGAAVAEAQMKLSELGTRLDDLTAKVSALPQTEGASAEVLGQLTTRLDGLEQQVKGGLSQAAAATAAPRALTSALAGLEAKLAEGAPFIAELKAAREAAPQLGALAALEPIAAAGAPTVDQLKASFASVITAVNTPGEAPAAAEPQTMWDTVVSKLSSVIKVRHRSAVEWPDAVVAVSKQLADNDLAAAVATLSRTANPPPAVADWLRSAQARLDADTALQAAMPDALRLISGTANGG
jgi:hypothetical protein